VILLTTWPRGGGSPVELAAGKLVLPGGVGVGKHGTVYVTAPVFGPGEVLRIGRHHDDD